MKIEVSIYFYMKLLYESGIAWINKLWWKKRGARIAPQTQCSAYTQGHAATAPMGTNLRLAFPLHRTTIVQGLFTLFFIICPSCLHASEYRAFPPAKFSPIPPPSSLCSCCSALPSFECHLSLSSAMHNSFSQWGHSRLSRLATLLSYLFLTLTYYMRNYCKMY